MNNKVFEVEDLLVLGNKDNSHIILGMEVIRNQDEQRCMTRHPVTYWNFIAEFVCNVDQCLRVRWGAYLLVDQAATLWGRKSGQLTTRINLNKRLVRATHAMLCIMTHAQQQNVYVLWLPAFHKICSNKM